MCTCVKKEQRGKWKHNAVHSHRTQKKRKRGKAIHMKQTKKKTCNMCFIDEKKKDKSIE